MNGMSVIMNATRKMPAAMEEILSRNQMTAADVDTFLVHQANANLLARIAKTLNTPAERFFSNIARYGNTSSASMLIAASEWAESGQSELASDSNLVFCAFGAGFHWGAVLAKPA
jgi:3-oxoacyl-[acyl-carrier-protein] synthase-3